jgi:hypothetical protein
MSFTYSTDDKVSEEETWMQEYDEQYEMRTKAKVPSKRKGGPICMTRPVHK